MATIARPESRSSASTGYFLRHFIEMVLAMVVGMFALGGVLQLVLALLGHSDLFHYAGLRAFVMTINMAVGMSVWMRHRRHTWTSVAEMAAAMFFPFMALIGPYVGGVLPAGALLAAMHVLMLPCMLAVMICRRSEYALDHRYHSHKLPAVSS